MIAATRRVTAAPKTDHRKEAVATYFTFRPLATPHAKGTESPLRA